MRLQKFTLTEDHLKLLRRMYVGWCPDEYGAPEIDPKRPYGNSDVEWDVHEILANGSRDDFGEDADMPLELERKYYEIHKETQTALQVVLATGTFEPGEYTADSYSYNWQRTATFKSMYDH